MFNIQIRNRHAHSRRDKIVSKHTYSRKKMSSKSLFQKAYYARWQIGKPVFFIQYNFFWSGAADIIFR